MAKVAAYEKEMNEDELKSFNADVMGKVHTSIKTENPEHVKIT